MAAMNSFSPGSRLQSKQPAKLDLNSLTDPATIAALTNLRNLISSTYGPRGRMKVIHNNKGGHVLVTSSGTGLLNSLSVNNQLLRLVTSSLQAFSKTFPDGTLFTALTTLNLILNSLQLNLHPRLTSEIHQFLLQESLAYLQDESHGMKVRLDVSNYNQLELLVTGVIGTKPACNLASSDVSHVSRVLIHAFIKGLEPSPARSQLSRINYVYISGSPPSDSHLWGGVLLASPEIPTYRKKGLEFTMTAAGEVKVALFNISLAGDEVEAVDAAVELEEGADMEQWMVDTLEEVVRRMVKDGVGFVFSQKVVHPRIKRRLRQGGIHVTDRLGSQLITAVQALTGSGLIGSLSHPDLSASYGTLTSVRHVVLGHRSFLHLQKPDSHVCSVVLCNRSEAALDEMKLVSVAVQDVLRMALVSPAVLVGGGIWQAALAQHLRSSMVDLDCKSLDKVISPYVNRCQLRAVTDAFCQAFCQRGVTGGDVEDGSAGLISYDNCDCGTSGTDLPPGGREESCGLLRTISKTQSTLPGITAVDLFECAVNGLKTAVATADMVLRVQHALYDTN